MGELKSLSKFFAANNKVALAFSGGADSTFLLHKALSFKADVLPIFVHSAFNTDEELDDALRFCESEGVELVVVEADVLANPDIVANNPDRCYHCKKMVFSAVTEAARERGYEVIIDGTNDSDSPDDRPGMRVLDEMGILSPLRLSGLSKSTIMRISRSDRLPTWNKPSNSCLATRVRFETPITEDILLRVDGAEKALGSMGFTGFRVRNDGVTAKVIFMKSQRDLAVARQDEIVSALSKFFENVVIDEETRG